MAIAQSTWVAITDGAKASILQYLGPGKLPEPVEGGQMTHRHERTSELVDNKRGRVFQSADGTRSAMEDTSDAHEHEKQVFSREVADFLSQRENEYDRIILVSAPKTLGYLRKQIPDRVRKKVMAEIDKDLTHTPVAELPKHLQSVINI